MLAIVLTPAARGQVAAGTPLSATPGASPHAIDATPGALATPVAGEPEPGTLAAFGYDDMTAQGMYASLNYYVPLPPDSMATEGGELHLVYSHSPLLVSDLSTMTVVINGQSVESVHLAPDNEDHARLVVPMPVAGFKGNTIAIRIAFHLRLTRDQCEVADDPALWASIHKESSLSFQTTSDDSALLLTDLPRLFQTQGANAPLAPAIILPEAPGPEVLDAAGIVAYQFGRWSGRVQQDPVLGTLSASAPAPDVAALLIGQGKDLPVGERWGGVTWDGTQFLLNDVPVPADSGVLALRQQPVPQLLVSGTTPEAVRKAALALTHPLDDAFFGSSAVVIGEALPGVAATRNGWTDGAASFAQLGMASQEITGPGLHYTDLRFERPAGWVLRDGGTLQLALSVSPGVRTETSWVRAIVNGVDIGAQPLHDSTKDGNRYVFVLPAGRLNNDLDGQPLRQLSVQLRIYLDTPQQGCEVSIPRKHGQVCSRRRHGCCPMTTMREWISGDSRAFCREMQTTRLRGLCCRMSLPRTRS